MAVRRFYSSMETFLGFCLDRYYLQHELTLLYCYCSFVQPNLIMVSIGKLSGFLTSNYQLRLHKIVLIRHLFLK